RQQGLPGIRQRATRPHRPPARRSEVAARPSRGRRLMPAGQPFTRLCQQLSQLRAESQRADLHLHTTHSDGRFTPAEVVRRAKERGLGAIAITDHDTCSGIREAQEASRAFDSPPEIITGVEITCDYRDGILHLLGYFFDPDDGALSAALAELRARRRERFAAMLA